MGRFINKGGVVVKIENGKEFFITDLRKRKGLKKNAKNIVKNLNIINDLPVSKKRQEEFDAKHKPINAGTYNMDDKLIKK